MLYNGALRTLKHLISRYTAWIWGLLQPLGAWGVFGIGFIDSALLGMPLDAVVGGYVYSDPHRAWLYCIMAAAGSAAGSVIIYFIGRKGGELTLEQRVGKQRLDTWRDRFERQEFWALAIPAMLPPPTPFKLLLLAAGAFDMHLRDFLLAIFVGRLLRFAILAVLVVEFGPQVVSVVGNVVRDHPAASLAVFVVSAVLLGWWIFTKVLRRRAA